MAVIFFINMDNSDKFSVAWKDVVSKGTNYDTQQGINNMSAINSDKPSIKSYDIQACLSDNDI